MSKLKRVVLGTPRKKTILELRRRADMYFSKYIRYRDGRFSEHLGAYETQCITCLRWLPMKEMQAGHFVSRKVNALRFDEENVNGQCFACNVMKNGEQYEYARQLDMKYGDGTAAKLHDRRNELHSFSRNELEKIAEDAKSFIHDITGILTHSSLD